MKTDQIFYSIFKEFPQIFFELIGETNIDITAYEFNGSELKETALRLDGIMLRVPKDPKQPIYFIEVPFQKKERIYSNLFAKVFLYLERDFKQTRLGRELWAEGREEGLLQGEEIGRLKAKLETVPVMLERGFTVEEVADILNLEVEQVREITQ